MYVLGRRWLKIQKTTDFKRDFSNLKMNLQVTQEGPINRLKCVVI